MFAGRIVSGAMPACVVFSCALILLVMTQAATAQSVSPASRVPAPQTRQEWMRAAWALMAAHREVPQDMPDRVGRFEVQVVIRVERDGTLTEAEIRRSSGRPALDGSAMRMIARSAPFPPLPPDMEPTERLTLPVIFEFEPSPDQERSVIDAKTLYESRRLMARRRAADRL